MDANCAPTLLTAVSPPLTTTTTTGPKSFFYWTTTPESLPLDGAAAAADSDGGGWGNHSQGRPVVITPHRYTPLIGRSTDGLGGGQSGALNRRHVDWSAGNDRFLFVSPVRSWPAVAFRNRYADPIESVLYRTLNGNRGRWRRVMVYCEADAEGKGREGDWDGEGGWGG